MIMKYKDFGTMLSKDEMKEVKGGGPPIYWTCSYHGIPYYNCYLTLGQCHSYCYGYEEECLMIDVCNA
jgi:hypothetical protein